MPSTLARWGVVALLCAATLPAFASCPPRGLDAAALERLRVDAFEVADPDARAALALELADCLGDPDPGLRDGIAYEALAAWMRSDRLSTETLAALRERLYGLLDGPRGEGFARPFAALVLAEVARTDRKSPWMDGPEREAMVAAAVRYERSIDDYRGFDSDAGWRHGVAHGADWLMQLSLNPAIDEAQLRRIIDAAGAQAVPDAHAYVFGEPARLAAPVVYAAARGLMDEAGWTAWFGAMPARLGDASLAWKDGDWLARRHDLHAFLSAVHLMASTSGDAELRRLLPGVEAALAAMP